MAWRNPWAAWVSPEYWTEADRAYVAAERERLRERRARINTERRAAAWEWIAAHPGADCASVSAAMPEDIRVPPRAVRYLLRAHGRDLPMGAVDKLARLSESALGALADWARTKCKPCDPDIAVSTAELHESADLYLFRRDLGHVTHSQLIAWLRERGLRIVRRNTGMHCCGLALKG
jgi:hypothetical protein